MKIKHYSIFHTDLNFLHWESLRNNNIESSYYLPYTKEEYLLKVGTDAASPIANRILQEIEKSGLKKVFSIGSGIAALEYQLKLFSNYAVVVSDYNSSVLRLKQFDIFNDAVLLDAFKDPLPIDNTHFVLFPRIDTEFNDQQLTELFAKCHSIGIQQICFIPAELLSLKIWLAEIKILLISKLKRKKRIFCGYARSLKSFTAIWNPYYTLRTESKAGKKVFFLHAK